MKMDRHLTALVSIALLAACTGSPQSSVVPASGVSQPQAASQAVPDKNGQRFLYVADIDGQPGVGQIHVYPASMKNPQQIRTITSGTGRPIGLWVDSKNILYAANFPNKYPSSVTEFKPGASSPFFQITNFKVYPGSVAVDAQQNVYVNESYEDEGWIQEFAPGSNVAERTIDSGVGGYAFAAGSMAFDPHGNLIIAEQAKLKLALVEIPAGSSQPVRMNLDLNGHNIDGPGMGIDKAGNIYVASSGNVVAVFPPGQTEPSRYISPVGGYGLTWVTPQGAVYQASGEGTVIEVAPGSNTPTNTIYCECSAQGAAVSH